MKTSLIEAPADKRVGMNDDETKLKKTLMHMLINKDGKWGPYKHPAYAERLQDFDLYIVPVKDDPDLTACVSFEDHAIYISEGFLTDPKYFYQLNVIIRHEMAHNLLRHEIRMMSKLSPKIYDKLAHSPFHDILNIDLDFEISNRKYTSEDKKIMRKLWLNGKFIKCLVTEDHRKDWFDPIRGIRLTAEEMYDKTVAELDKLNRDLIEARDNSWKAYDVQKRAESDIIVGAAMASVGFMDRKSPSFVWDPAEEFFKRGKFFKKKLPTVYQELTKQIYNIYKDVPEETVKADFERLTDSKITDPVVLKDGCEVITPQEKLIANNVLKYYLGNKAPTPEEVTIKVEKAEHSAEYKKAYNEIIKKLGSRAKCDDETLSKILSEISGGGTGAEEVDYEHGRYVK